MHAALLRDKLAKWAIRSASLRPNTAAGCSKSHTSFPEWVPSSSASPKATTTTHRAATRWRIYSADFRTGERGKCQKYDTGRVGRRILLSWSSWNRGCRKCSSREARRVRRRQKAHWPAGARRRRLVPPRSAPAPGTGLTRRCEADPRHPDPAEPTVDRAPGLQRMITAWERFRARRADAAARAMQRDAAAGGAEPTLDRWNAILDADRAGCGL